MNEEALEVFECNERSPGGLPMIAAGEASRSLSFSRFQKPTDQPDPPVHSFKQSVFAIIKDLKTIYC